MQLRIANSGTPAGFLATGLSTGSITVGAAGHSDVSIAVPGATAGSTFFASMVVEAGGAGLVASGAKCDVDGTVVVRIENPSAAPIGATTAHVNLLVLFPGVLGV